MGALCDKDRELVMAAVDDLVADFLYYGRKEDEDLPQGKIEALVQQSFEGGEDLVEDICDRFRAQLLDGLDLEEEEDAEDE